MIQKYKLLKEFPDSPPVGTILYSTDEGYFYIESCRKATANEIISYYEQQGLVKGAKFNWKDSYSENYENNLTFYNFDWLGGILYAMTIGGARCELDNCTLIPTPTVGGGYIVCGCFLKD